MIRIDRTMFEEERLVSTSLSEVQTNSAGSARREGRRSGLCVAALALVGVLASHATGVGEGEGPKILAVFDSDVVSEEGIKRSPVVTVAGLHVQCVNGCNTN